MYIWHLSIFLLTITMTEVHPQIENLIGHSYRKSPRFIFFVPFSSDSASRATFFTKQSVCTPSGSNVAGSCSDYFTCLIRRGKAIGLCHYGAKACCMYTVRGTGTIKTSTGIFVNENNPSSSQLTIKRASRQFCQVRLDFDEFSLVGPDVDGSCSTDSLVIPGQIGNDIVICGQNKGQHVYLRFSSSRDIVLDLTTSSSIASWTIKVLQIECSDSAKLAPLGCLQYFQGISGTVSSFNYPDLITTVTDKTYQISNLNYQICIDSASTYCAVSWNRNDQQDASFTITGDVSRVPEKVILGDPTLLDTNENCKSDFIQILRGEYTIINEATKEETTDIANRFCGLGFPTAVESSTLRMGVFTDGYEASGQLTDVGNAGFQLHYNLVQCR